MKKKKTVGGILTIRNEQHKRRRALGPQAWDGPKSEAARYRAIGNSVVVPVLSWIGQRMIQSGGQ